jgi:fused signal recognition particle receptor
MFNFFGREKIRESLSRTRNSIFGQINTLFGGNEITEELWEDLEALLIQADVGVETTELLLETVQERVRKEGIYRPADAQQILKEEMQKLLEGYTPSTIDKQRILTVILVVGVNGSGKTTTIAKLAHYYQLQGKTVTLAAADTFRAAAIEQIKIWGERAGATVISHQANADPGAVVFDAIKSGLARKTDMVIIDTAGRLHTKFNLMKELRSCAALPASRYTPHPTRPYWCLMLPPGQNAISQAKHFKETVEITGVVLTKLDGTAKGGVVFAIGKTMGVPVRFVGVGEGLEDLMPFDSAAFVDGLFEE